MRFLWGTLFRFWNHGSGNRDVLTTEFDLLLRGLAASAAANPTSSVPANEKAAVTNTLQRPLKP